MRCEGGACRPDSNELIGEEPLLIRIEGKPYSVVMRTPGNELFHAAGFCLGEGIADSPDDFLTIGFCRDLDPNVIEVRLKPERLEKIPEVLERRGFVSQTSCGICGKEMVKDLYQVLSPVADGPRIGFDRIRDCLRTLSEKQDYYPRTRGAHAAALFDPTPAVLAFAEDVGRHNALDKAVGAALMNRKLSAAEVLVMSSRLSYELVQKAARARLPILVSLSRPTALAVEMGRSLNMTIACVEKEGGWSLFCGEDRILF
jgi:FdhD protein